VNRQGNPSVKRIENPSVKWRGAPWRTARYWRPAFRRLWNLLAASALGLACGTLSARADDLQPHLHFRPENGWLGDAHPVFWGGQWHVYYLQIPQEPQRHDLDGLHSAEIVSKDLIHWTRQEIKNTDPQRTWWAIANLRVENTLYSFYNGPTGFDLSLSQDGKVWTPYAHNPVVPYPQNGIPEIRDPVIFQEPRTGLYSMVVAGKRQQGLPPGHAGLFLVSTSSDLQRWTPLTPLYDPGDIGIPECPDLFKLGSRYYLLGSWGIDRVGQGRYRVADSMEGPWRVPAHDTLDGTELMAPNTGRQGGNRLLFGWIPTYKGGRDFAPYEWGGHLAFPREIYRGPGDALYLRLPKAFLALRKETISVASAACEIVNGDWTRGPAGLRLATGSAFGEFWLPGERERFEVEATLTPSQGCTEVGLVFRAGNPAFPGYEIAIDLKRQRLLLRHHRDASRSLAETRIQVRPNAPLKLRVFVDGDIVEAFLDDRFSLAGRAHTAPAHRTGFYSVGGACEIRRPTLYRLEATRPNTPEQTVHKDAGQKGATGRIAPDRLLNARRTSSPILEK
jgi:beta-fructofuranosidase